MKSIYLNRLSLFTKSENILFDRKHRMSNISSIILKDRQRNSQYSSYCSQSVEEVVENHSIMSNSLLGKLINFSREQ